MAHGSRLVYLCPMGRMVSVGSWPASFSGGVAEPASRRQSWFGCGLGLLVGVVARATFREIFNSDQVSGEPGQAPHGLIAQSAGDADWSTSVEAKQLTGLT